MVLFLPKPVCHAGQPSAHCIWQLFHKKDRWWLDKAKQVNLFKRHRTNKRQRKDAVKSEQIKSKITNKIKNEPFR